MTSAATRFSLLHIEAVGGVAGDMLLAGLLDLGADASVVRGGLARLGEPEISLDLQRVRDGDQEGLHVRSVAPGSGHPHHHLADIQASIAGADLPAAAAAAAAAIFLLLCEAEAEVHGGSAADVHLHEVGELDSIMDVVGIALAWHSLGAPRVQASALPSGSGIVETSHGPLTCPVPAVRAIAERFAVPLREAPLAGETVTPTGIAVLAHLCGTGGFGHPPPPVNPESRIGIGVGTRRFAACPNVVRIHGYP